MSRNLLTFQKRIIKKRKRISNFEFFPFPEKIEEECLALFKGYADTFPEGDYTWSSDECALKEFLMDVSLPEGILDAGCGPGVYLKEALSKSIGRNGIVVGADFCIEMLQRAKREDCKEVSKFICGNLKYIPFHNESFGLVLCTNNTLGNIPANDSYSSFILRLQIIKNLIKLIKDGGAFFCSVYNIEKLNLDEPYSADRWIDFECSNIEKGELFIWRKDAQGNLSRVYSHWFELEELKFLLENARLKNISIREEGCHFQAFAIKH